MDQTSIFTVRHFQTQRDFAGLVTLLQTIEQADQDGEDASEAALREQLTWPGHDPALDRWVAFSTANNELIGYGVIFHSPNDEHADLHVAVHPRWRRQGIGSALLAQVLERAHEKGAQDVRAYATVQHVGARAFLQAHAFEPVATYTRMFVAAIRSFPKAEMPPGFVIRKYDDVQQLDLLIEAMNQSYEGLWGHRHVSREEWIEWFPDMKSMEIFLLFASDGAVAGICRGELSEHLTALRGVPTGLVDAPGVVPAYRQAGLYVPLLLTALHSLLAQSPARIEMESWGDAATTLSSYKELGFTPLQEARSYRRVLEPISPQRAETTTHVEKSEEEILSVRIGGITPLNGPIQIDDYNPVWPTLFEREAARICAALGDRVALLEHVGSTSVPGLAAKPRIDILLVVPNSADEPSYVPPLEAAGYVLRIREPDWHEHRVFKGPDTDVNLHVFSPGSTEIERMLLFRDWLRNNPSDRELYEHTKRELAQREWKYTQNYADAKTEVVEEIMARARKNA